MTTNPRYSQYGGASSPNRGTGVYTGKITLIYDDGRVRVFINTFGRNIGPCRIINKSAGDAIALNDEVLCTYANDTSDELIVVGRLTERVDPVSESTSGLVVEASTTSALVRITQKGAGAALLVEDSTNPDSTPFIIDTLGNVGIGVSSPTAKIDVSGAAVISGNLTVDTTTFKVDSSTDRVGIGTASPLSKLHIADTSGYGVQINTATNLGLIGSNGESDGLRVSGGIPDQVTVGGNMYLYGNTHATRAADIALMSNGNEVLTVDGATLRVGIGVLSPATALDIIGTATVRAAATQDGVALAGRAGGNQSWEVTLTPTTLSADRTLTLPDASGTVALTDSAMTSSTFIGTTSVALNRSSGALTLAGITLTTPVLGVASATTINKVALTAPATGSTLTIADGKTLTASNTLTFTGTDASSVAFGAGGTVAYTNVATLSSLTSVGTLTNLTVTNAINGTLTKTVTGTNTADLIYGNMADNDQFRIRIGGTATNAGYVEIATADDGTEPIYVRQYTGVFSSLTRTATLLDGSGNTSFPGTVTAGTFVTNNSSPSLELGDWSASSTWSAVDGYNGYLLLGNTSNRACYLRSNNAAAVNIGANGSDTLVVNNGNIVVNGTTVNDTLNVIGGSAWFSAMPASTGATVINTFGFLRYVSSRRELKENIVDVELSDGLGRILALRPVEFTMKPEYLADANEYTPFDVKRGFIAQETAEVDHRYGQWGWVDENQMMATEPAVKGELPLEDATPIYWNHDAVIADLVASIQVLTARISELEASQ